MSSKTLFDARKPIEALLSTYGGELDSDGSHMLGGEWNTGLSDEHVIRLVNQDPDRAALFAGDISRYGHDPSRADAALLAEIAFFSGPDPEQIERVFGTSSLARRDKWIDREDYRELSIRNAIELRGYDPANYYGGSRMSVDDLTDSSSRSSEDFYAYLPKHQYIYRPTGELWPQSSVDRTVPPDVGVDGNGKPKRIPASVGIDRDRAVSQMTWAPGNPEVLEDWVATESGWKREPGERIYNRYRGPNPPDGAPVKAKPWIDHINSIYPDDAEHLVEWFADRVQNPGQKINHALVLGGKPGIGKDTIVEPVRYAVGPWNVGDISPTQATGRFNGFLRNVILRVSEARDQGEVNRYGFYEHMKPLTAAPPEMLRVDEKYTGEYYVQNVVGIIYTTNNRTNGLYLPSDDRRHYVTWSEREPSEFPTGYFEELYDWYASGGNGHVAAYLAAYDLSGFDPKAPPKKTPAFWDMVDASRAPEEGELADLLDGLGRPDAVTLETLTEQIEKIRGVESLLRPSELEQWLRDRKNRRQIPHRLESVGYLPVHNPTAQNGLWVIGGKRQTVYARLDLSRRDQIAAATRLREH